MNQKKQLVINFFGGPCSGKSTMAAAVFATLKWNKITCELVREPIKDLIWEATQNSDTPVKADQLDSESMKNLFSTISAKISALHKKVDVIVTDSPLLHTLVYEDITDTSEITRVRSEHEKYDNINFVLLRGDQYDPMGRLHTEDEAKQVDAKILEMLVNNESDPGLVIPIQAVPESIDYILELITNRLSQKPTIKNLSK